MNKHISKFITFACLLFVSSLAQATIMQHTFTITGDLDESGSGSFTWDNDIIPDGTMILTTEQLLSLSITLTGTNVEATGGSTTFTLADCTNVFGLVAGPGPEPVEIDVVLANTPDFNEGITFWCDNGTDTLYAVDFYVALLNDTDPTPTKPQLDKTHFKSLAANARPPGVVFFAPGFSRPLNSEPAPTLSEWMLILLAIMLGGIGYTATIKTKKS